MKFNAFNNNNNLVSKHLGRIYITRNTLNDAYD